MKSSLYSNIILWHGLCRNFQASSQNFTIYGGVRWNW